MKKVKLLFITLLLAVSILGTMSTVSASAKPKLSKSKVSVHVGKKTTIKLKNAKKKVKWSIKNSKIAKISKVSGKYSDAVKIKAKKKGTTYLYAKVGSKKYKCKITVKNKKKQKGSISYACYTKIRKGMTYAEVCEIFGSSGELVASSSFENYTTSIYSWSNDDLDNFFVASICFENNRVSTMAETHVN